MSAAPCISRMPNPPPAVKTGNTVRCAVSLASSVVVTPTPARIAAAASPATTVLPRSSPCWSANASRSVCMSRWPSTASARSAASRCSGVHRPWRSTKDEDGAAGRFDTGAGRRCRRRRQAVAGATAPGASGGATSGGAPDAVHHAQPRAAPGVDLAPVLRPALGRADAVDRRRSAQGGGRSGVEHHRRRAALLDGVDRLVQQPAVWPRSPVAGARCSRVRSWIAPMRLDRPLVVHVDVGAHAGVGLRALLVRIEAVVVAAVPARAVVGQLVQLEPLRAHQRLVDRLAEAGEERVPVVVAVVDRHVVLRDRRSRRTAGSRTPAGTAGW